MVENRRNQHFLQLFFLVNQGRIGNIHASAIRQQQGGTGIALCFCAAGAFISERLG
jgi:hypothetical protein